MPVELKQQPIPRVAFGGSILIAAIAIGSAFVFPERDIGLGVLIWITAVIPAFLLAYFRGLGGAAVALAASMAAIAGIQASVAALDPAESLDSLPATSPGLYLGVLIGMVVLVEMLYRERRTADATALVDRLTGLPNRGYVDKSIEQEFAAAARGRDLAVIIFDIDRLDAVNKRLGQPSGDAVIRAFAKVLQANTRKENLSARYGGGQFITVLREADTPAAQLFAQRVLDQMRDIPFSWGRQTVSAGIGTYEAGMGSYELLIGAADRALFRAKESGRDSVAVAPDKVARAAIAQRTADAERDHAADGGAASAPGPRLVYLVDDDAAVRSAVKGILAGHGFRVWDTESPAAAIKRYVDAAPEDRPAVIVSDVIMPAMTGMRMIEQIAAHNPAVRVVYMSGFVHGDISWSGLPGGTVKALQKPFEMDALIGAVNEMIGDG
ncbi:MAG: diguanylate cyclase [Gemmatimonadetes bacterium]|nr:diguanylate cyclase [Gemmatimonadota bacterium]